MKNEEKFAFAFLLGTLLFVVFCFVMSAFTGCASTSIRHDPGRVRESSAYIIGQLESSIEEFDTGLRREIERSRGLESEIERLDCLFRAYEQAALRLRDEVSRVRDEAKDSLEGRVDADRR